jgi:hypothetical protein
MATVQNFEGVSGKLNVKAICAYVLVFPKGNKNNKIPTK